MKIVIVEVNIYRLFSKKASVIVVHQLVDKYNTLLGSTIFV